LQNPFFPVMQRLIGAQMITRPVQAWRVESGLYSIAGISRLSEFAAGGGCSIGPKHDNGATSLGTPAFGQTQKNSL
jgi:hypothetical protein